MNVNKTFKRFVGGAVVAGIALVFAGNANALPAFGSGLIAGNNSLSDDSFDFVVQNDANSTLDVGDYLIGGIQFTSMTSGAIPGTTVNEGTALFAIEVTSVVGGFPCFGFASGCASFTFDAPLVGFNAALNAAGLDYNPDAVGLQAAAYSANADTVLVTLEDATGPYPGMLAAGSLQAAVDIAAGGTQIATVDLIGTDFWSAIGPVDPADAAGILPGTNIGSVAVNATISSVFGSFLGKVPVPQTVSGGGALFSAPSNLQAAGIFITDDVTINQLFAVPEPATLALLGIGLAGIGGLTRRRRKA